MKRTVVYIRATSPIVVGESAVVIPLNHPSGLVMNGHECITTAVRSIAEDGTTFETLNTIYKLIAGEEPAQAKKRELERVE